MFGLFEILKLMFQQDFEVVLQMWSRKQIEETMVACHMKAKYIYTYVGLTTMIWEIQQMNSKSNVCICICKIWIQIQIQMQMHHRHHQLQQDFVGLNLSFCHHHPFAFVQFVALWSPAAINLMFAEQTEVFAIQIWIFAKPNWIFAQGPLSFLRGTLNIKC